MFSVIIMIVQWEELVEFNGLICGYCVYYIMELEYFVGNWQKYNVDDSLLIIVGSLLEDEIYIVWVFVFIFVGDGFFLDFIQVKMQQGVFGQFMNLWVEVRLEISIMLFWSFLWQESIIKYEFFFWEGDYGWEVGRIFDLMIFYVVEDLKFNMEYVFCLVVCLLQGLGVFIFVVWQCMLQFKLLVFF